MSPLLSLARRIIAINSTGPAGTVALARFVGTRLKRLGFSVAFQKRRIKGVHQTNLIARIGPKGASPLLINTHLDTVVTDRKRWTKTGGNPLRAVVRSGYLYGLGSADTKTALACQITALKGLDLTKLKRPLFLTGTFAEETGMPGMKELIRSGRLRGIRHALNSEPTELRPVIGHHGFRVYRIETTLSCPPTADTLSHQGRGKAEEVYFKGKAAHSARPRLGRNAIVDCLKWVVKNSGRHDVVEMEGGLEANIVAPFCRVKFVRVPPLPCPSPSRGEGKRERVMKGDFGAVAEGLLQFLKLSGKKGQTHNLGVIRLIGNRLIAKIDHRFPPGVDPGPREKELRCFFPSGTIHLERDNPPFHQSRKSKLVREVGDVLKSMGKQAGPLVRPGCSEAGYLAKVADEVLTIGPGKAYGNAHQPNERVKIAELEKAVGFYREIIARLCL